MDISSRSFFNTLFILKMSVQRFSLENGLTPLKDKAGNKIALFCSVPTLLQQISVCTKIKARTIRSVTCF